MSSENAKLARLMRECASYVERNEFSPSMYQVIGELHAYAGKHSDAKGQLSNKQSAVAGSWNALGKKFQNFGIAATSSQTKHATSNKNADRVKQDLDDVKKSGSGAEDDSWTTWWTSSGLGGDDKPAAPSKPGKPAFQRPSNPKSTLIANGWIEQLRRSKMRVVWKDVLASLVEGRKEKEETTLWIQREVTNASTGKHELEALHQIPIKWLQEVKYLDFYGDFRFAIKVFNVSDEFVFRCADEESAQNWILTLRSFKMDEKPQKQLEQPKQQQQHAEATAPFDEDDGKQFVSPPDTGGAPSSIRSVPVSATVYGAARAASSRSLGVDPPPAAEVPTTEQQDKPPRMTVKEMRAIAHGSGVSTQGMERSDLERLVARLTGVTSAAAVTSSTKAAEEKHRQEVELARRRQALEHQESLQRKAEAVAIDREHDDEKRRLLEEAQRQRVGNARRKGEEEELKRLAAIAEKQLRAAALVEERRRVDEQRRQAVATAAAEDQRRRVVEQQAVEQRRRQEEERARAQQHYQQQQQAWQHQQAAQQQWQQQQAAAAQQQAAAQQAAAQHAQAAQQAQWQQYHQQQQKQQQSYPQQQPQQQTQNPFGNAQQQSKPPAPAATNGDTSTADLKYTKMAEESKDDEQKIAAVKRNILVHWALQPPQQQHLRPIADLLTNIHTVFPPAFGVSGHAYFAKWTAVNRTDLAPVGSGPDEEKLKKAVRKLRFFLHPDKLPRDLNDEQTFMCKMLWDISSDAWEEYKKRHEELDWIQK